MTSVENRPLHSSGSSQYCYHSICQCWLRNSMMNAFSIIRLPAETRTRNLRGEASVITYGRNKKCTQIHDSKYHGNRPLEDHDKGRRVILKLFLRKQFTMLLIEMASFAVAGFCSDCDALLVSISAYCCVRMSCMPC
jgi:hypothetical protein